MITFGQVALILLVMLAAFGAAMMLIDLGRFILRQIDNACVYVSDIWWSLRHPD